MSDSDRPKFRPGDRVRRAGTHSVIEQGIVREPISASTGLRNHWWVYWEVTELKMEHEDDLIPDPDHSP